MFFSSASASLSPVLSVRPTLVKLRVSRWVLSGSASNSCSNFSSEIFWNKTHRCTTACYLTILPSYSPLTSPLWLDGVWVTSIDTFNGWNKILVFGLTTAVGAMSLNSKQRTWLYRFCTGVGSVNEDWRPISLVTVENTIDECPMLSFQEVSARLYRVSKVRNEWFSPGISWDWNCYFCNIFSVNFTDCKHLNKTFVFNDSLAWTHYTVSTVQKA